ncbi:hypothetical protein [Pseudobacteroides cellulosolvens]|uniref:hypothetical protein n=1 Tax=Pseudobacteroides cellulosolvens TaxID=35825 RepID=UPI0012B5AC7D|nr:hypothetical protein [Pseudobacteroides cellulosolvens]
MVLTILVHVEAARSLRSAAAVIKECLQSYSPCRAGVDEQGQHGSEVRGSWSATFQEMIEEINLEMYRMRVLSI